MDQTRIEDIEECSPPIMLHKQPSIFERKFSSFHLPPRWTLEPAYRLTHSDVMCISNSGMIMQNQPQHHTKDRSSQSKSCNLPYEELYTSTTSSRNHPRGTLKRHATLLQHKHSEEQRKKLDRQLHEEHRLFMNNLKQEREERLRIETDAAIIIQQYMRGLDVRRSMAPGRYAAMSGRGDKNQSYDCCSDREVWNVLFYALDKIGIKPTKDMLLGCDPPPEFANYMKGCEEVLLDDSS